MLGTLGSLAMWLIALAQFFFVAWERSRGHSFGIHKVVQSRSKLLIPFMLTILQKVLYFRNVLLPRVPLRYRLSSYQCFTVSRQNA